MKLTKCPYCKKEFASGCLHHIKKCIKDNKLNKTREEFIEDVYKYNIPEIIKTFQEEYKHMSLPDFKKKYGLHYEQTLTICKILKIKPRNFKESANLEERNKKIKETNLKRYGDINALGKKSPLYKKRNETVKIKYGVENVFQLKEVKEKSSETLYKKYGVYKTGHSKEIREKIKNTNFKKYGDWFLASEENRTVCLKGTTNNRLTKPHKIVSEYLNGLGIEHYNEKSDEVRYLDENNKKHYVIPDIILKKEKKIIEVYGDYWHGNPSLYEEDQQLNFNGHLVQIKEIWNRDKYRKEKIEELGYKVLVIWQYDVYNNFDEVKEKINEFVI